MIIHDLKLVKKIMLKKNEKIFIAGHNGLVGSAVLRKLKEQKYKIVARKKYGRAKVKKKFSIF